MENNIKNKGAFFALYWGQRVKFFTVNGPNFLQKIGKTYMIQYHILNSSLLLRTINQLSEKELIQLIKKQFDELPNQFQISEVFNSDKYKGLEYYYFHSRLNKKLLGSVALTNGSKKLEDLNSNQIDFLRSIGIAVPWNGVSVEKQIEYGWIKLKD